MSQLHIFSQNDNMDELPVVLEQQPLPEMTVVMTLIREYHEYILV